MNISMSDSRNVWLLPFCSFP